MLSKRLFTHMGLPDNMYLQRKRWVLTHLPEFLLWESATQCGCGALQVGQGDV